MRVDLPTLGKPTSPTSASSFSSSSTSKVSPGQPPLAKRGIWRVAVAKWLLPQPPLPPRATRTGWGPDRSASTRPVPVSRTTVPLGTWMTRSSPVLPEHRLEPPSWPFSAKYRLRYLKSIRLLRLVSATNQTSPPLPPSPPSGPPAATNFSRWKETLPLPPSPALMVMRA